MNPVEIIVKKREGKQLTIAEISFFINGYLNKTIPDYQMSSLLMAICLKGMSQTEIFALTDVMIKSGEIADLSKLNGTKIDKHSSGGVGDKVSLILLPILASLGLKVAKMSGRGLGHTGGTLDKLEAIPGFNVNLSPQELINQVNQIGLAIGGQNAKLVPADKELYALRDVTGTVNSIALIAASIMSKKIAANNDYIFLDVKYGDGAFMKNVNDAKILAKTMVAIGNKYNKTTLATISTMNQPLGYSIGNGIEVKEAIAALQGDWPSDLKNLIYQSGCLILKTTKLCDSDEQASQLIDQAINSGAALAKLRAMISCQGGDDCVINDPNKLITNHQVEPIYSLDRGYVKAIATRELGVIIVELGGGRLVKEDIIDHKVGIEFYAKIGDYVTADTVIAKVYSHKPITKQLKKRIQASLKLSTTPVQRPAEIEMIVED